MTNARHIGALISGHKHVAMIMTTIADRPSSRPVRCAEANGDRLSFLVDHGDEWVKAVERGEAVVQVTIADEHHNTYLAVNGRASVSTSFAERQRLWSAARDWFESPEGWFEGPDDPRLAVLTFDVSDGEYWDGPGRIGRAVDLMKAVLTNIEEPPDNQGQILGSS
jgi:general stress protein 26